jgi:hypothetical protein
MKKNLGIMLCIGDMLELQIWRFHLVFPQTNGDAVGFFLKIFC